MEPSEQIAGALNYLLTYWDEQLERWEVYAFCDTQENLQAKLQYARSKGYTLLRSFQLSELQ